MNRATLHVLASVLAAVVLFGCAAAAPSVTLSPPAASAPAPEMNVTATSIEAVSAPPGAIAVQAGEGPIFRPNVLEVPTGGFQIFLTSPAIDPNVQRATDGHNIGIRAPGSLDVIASSDYVKPGDPSIVFTVSGLEPGSYQFICEFRDHAGGGMRGTLTVAGG